MSSVGQASSEAALEALRRGAVEVLAKPSGPSSVGELGQILAGKIRAASRAKLRKPGEVPKVAAAAPVSHAFPASSLVAIGASTGGTQAIEELLLHMPEQCPPTVIVQQIPAVFSGSFASRLNTICKFEVKEARDGDLIAPGRVLVAPGNFHMLVRQTDGVYKVAVKDGPRVHYQRPAVDVLFQSVAEAGLRHMVGVLLTGMGSDGAAGLLRLRQKGLSRSRRTKPRAWCSACRKQPLRWARRSRCCRCRASRPRFSRRSHRGRRIPPRSRPLFFNSQFSVACSA